MKLLGGGLLAKYKSLMQADNFFSDKSTDQFTPAIWSICAMREHWRKKTVNMERKVKNFLLDDEHSINMLMVSLMWGLLKALKIKIKKGSDLPLGI